MSWPKYTTAAVIWLDHDSGDLHAEPFKTLEQAKDWTESLEYKEYKAIIIGMDYIGMGDWVLTHEDRT